MTESTLTFFVNLAFFCGLFMGFIKVMFNSCGNMIDSSNDNTFFAIFFVNNK
jgi:hypothetical protein